MYTESVAIARTLHLTILPGRYLTLLPIPVTAVFRKTYIKRYEMLSTQLMLFVAE
jgi:hypothetical protein